MTRIVLALCALALACGVQAQGFPVPGKPVRIVVPSPPGGQADIPHSACPNCGGELVRQPIRPAAKLSKYPASSERVYEPEGCGRVA